MNNVKIKMKAMLYSMTFIFKWGRGDSNSHTLSGATTSK